MPRSSLALWGLAVYGIALWEYRGSVRSSDAWWIRIQEQKARHIVSSLERMRNAVKPYETSLVTGIDLPFNPFNTTSSFILGYMGPKRFWTVIVPADVAESADDTARLIHANNPVRLQPPDHWFVFNADGSLAKELEHPPRRRSHRNSRPPSSRRRSPQPRGFPRSERSSSMRRQIPSNSDLLEQQSPPFSGPHPFWQSRSAWERRTVRSSRKANRLAKPKPVTGLGPACCSICKTRAAPIRLPQPTHCEGWRSLNGPTSVR